ncbi:hypothetical protein [Desulfobulbus alkaliphilus]|uniref:hypothetical protein n=1 Tax=Desulfobulbus alkaliphilus TaxID=869814 RepID=UPI0019657104|nr:hypothetical protein [Desulfobulbus alkaliphilus]MBM9537390.1 hypothetical protein [Desulfobulbus alkaliphilus]
MKKGVFAMALALSMAVTATGITFAAGSIGHGNIDVYKGGQLADKLSGQNPVEDGALLVCDGKCMIRSEGISLVAADQAKLAIRNEDQAFNLYLREGQVNYTITNNTRQIAFHTPQGTYTTAEVIFNADSNPVVRGYALVNQDGSTEIGVEEGRLVFATAEGMKTVDAHHKIILAVSEVPGDPVLTSDKKKERTVLFGALGAGLITTAIVAADSSGGSGFTPTVTDPTPAPPAPTRTTPSPRRTATPSASPNT